MNQNKMLRIFSGVAVVAMVLAFVSCSSEDGGNPAGSNTGDGDQDGTGEDDFAISIIGFSFSPANITVKVGATLTWTNMDSAPHTVTSDDGRFASSGNLSTNDTYRLTFSEAGTFPYHCSIHPSMKGTITVEL